MNKLKLFTTFALLVAANAHTVAGSAKKYTLLEKPALPLLGIVRFFESRPYPNDEEIAAMLIPGKHTYMRAWSKAIALVNPTETDDLNIEIPEGYIDPITNVEVRQIAMAAHTAKTLLKTD